jgi:uncharacterized damage-inducible protein DinB
MDAKSALKEALATADMIGTAYLSDLSDAEFMQRPHPACQHINWQVGHLIASEHAMLSGIAAGKMPPLPEGFAEKYSKETAGCDDPATFATKAELMEAYQAQRAATLAVLEGLSAEELDKETGVSYAPTYGSTISMQGAHWLMHCGQWVIVRRNNGKPIVI